MLVIENNEIKVGQFEIIPMAYTPRDDDTDQDPSLYFRVRFKNVHVTDELFTLENAFKYVGLSTVNDVKVENDTLYSLTPTGFSIMLIPKYEGTVLYSVEYRGEHLQCFFEIQEAIDFCN